MPETIDQLQRALGDRYLVDRVLGRGGNATVYLARDTKHDRPVAVKVLRPELAAILGTERFLQEIKVTANLQHPRILPLHDSGDAGGLPYYVMPYVEGESLRNRLDRETQLPVEDAIRITVAIANALDYAHGRDVVHRDIKPENLLLHDGEVVVADFGIALAFEQAGGTRLTETGLSLGTPSYMSPEQATGERDIDERTDIYALGTVLYEMLGGDPPFTGDTVQAVLARVITEPPRPIRSLRPSVPAFVDDALNRALAKAPAARFQSAGEFADALAATTTDSVASKRMSPRAKRVTGIAVLAAIALLAVFGFTFVRDATRRSWVKNTAIPEIERLVSAGEFSQAYTFAIRAQEILPNDPAVHALYEQATAETNVSSEPPGARVFYRGYSATDTTWYEAGITPLQQIRVPYWYVRLRFELDGYHPLELAVIPVIGGTTAQLVPVTEDDMVSIPAGIYSLGEAPVRLDSFLLDRHEVTNAQFQAFVDRGGYDQPDYWPAFGRDVSTDSARAAFTDATGRPGPASWELSRHPDGQEDYPVGGVSWYEAVAYCRSVGKNLPTYYHWKYAVGTDPWDDIIAHSNFSSGALPVATTTGVSPYGASDMAGNMREWVWSNTRGLRYILGGAWNEAEYMFGDHDAIDPWSRDATNGFRCAKFDSPPAPELLATVDVPQFDFNTVQPVDDETYAIYASFYAYDPIDLEARAEVVDSTRDWIKERVEFTAAYGDERVTAYVFLPTNAQPPYQTVVYYPGAAAFRLTSSRNLAEMAMVSFIPRSGRALVYPILKGTYERNIANRREGSAALRQRTVWAVQDLMRTVDYVMARDDLRNDQVAYMGLSLGAEITLPVALEKRFAALVLIGGAFDPAWRGVAPEMAPWNFASRVTTPTILINGRRDFMHPYATGQVPFFDAIAVPDDDKEFVVLEAGHIPPWNDVIEHSLRWLDRYLGPVQRR